ncbi:hypothetical protein L1286_22315 [Pseudoalteromonas sp. SMS1]|uniref:hypothetical protein n=1 Tax=Pseudoalteromonas sp. SMS1 TaxID=2908894 RepID=UPI001F47C512|nr:hypothetical protein [Pseudoalteromonas sp. SMS1]MCF2860219.1 hypothetical protein [Pseudoalteromonas sp. SMS1]
MNEVNSIEMLRLAMNMAATEQRLAMQNIASANAQVKSTSEVNFDALLEELNSLPPDVRAELAKQYSDSWHTQEGQFVSEYARTSKLDEEVALSMKAAGKFNKMTEVLNRKMGLMRLAVSGGKQ